MLIFPAIDLRRGQVVRLTEGDYQQMTVYGSDPMAVADAFGQAGAQYLHVVDLDAAGDEGQQNFSVIQRLARESGLKVEVGGGARDEKSVLRYMEAGVDRVILGTLAVENPALMEHLAARYPGRIAAGVDARDGRVAIHGWRMITDIDAFSFVKGLPERGVDTVIYTDIARDGRLMGPNLEAYEELQKTEGLRLVASGGIASEQDIRALAERGLYAAIIGRALYTGAVKLTGAISIGGGEKQ